MGGDGVFWEVAGFGVEVLQPPAASGTLTGSWLRGRGIAASGRLGDMGGRQPECRELCVHTFVRFRSSSSDTCSVHTVSWGLVNAYFLVPGDDDDGLLVHQRAARPV